MGGPEGQLARAGNVGSCKPEGKSPGFPTTKQLLLKLVTDLFLCRLFILSLHSPENMAELGGGGEGGYSLETFSS